jgi:hypothetical protein
MGPAILRAIPTCAYASFSVYQGYFLRLPERLCQLEANRRIAGSWSKSSPTSRVKQLRRLLHISFTLRGNGKLIRLISARTMHRKKRLRYEQEA